ncbi:uncharacterized protein FTOL_12541 [Fusarium torulosum]|uniref:Uncharacterized protein n=1 Tax=Fusarium torulosum TaxID=33205 RepID=A0AAE8SNZ4_9HYPO|nr:uncharacterized protein FTOL_12541 [Fusarium torulosum]
MVRGRNYNASSAKNQDD